MTPTPPGSATDRSGCALRGLVPALLFGCLAAGMPPAGAETGDTRFERYEVVLGPGGRPTVLPGFFLGGAAAEIAVLRRDGGGGARLRMYGLDGAAWAPVLDGRLGPGVRFVDVAEIAGRDRLIAYEPGRLSWFDPEAATQRTLLRLAISYRATDPVEIPRLEVARDLNGDGRDDLVLPDVDGFWISTQASDGSFTEPVKIGPADPFADRPIAGLDLGEAGPDRPRTYGEVGITAVTAPWYLGRVHRLDHDGDGRVDLAFWNGDRFDVHHQDEQGAFDPVAEPVGVDVAIDADGVYARMFDYGDQGLGALLFGLGEPSERTLLHALRDVDGDRIPDLLTLTLSGRALTRQRGAYEVHFGAATPDGVVFAPEAGTAIRPSGKAWGMQPWGYSGQSFADFDGDGRIDGGFRSVRVGMGGMMRTLVGNSVPMDVELYRLADGVYPERPTVRRRVRRFAPFAGPGNIFSPAVLMGDVNGDGRQDLLVGRGPRELQVFLGVAGPELLARRPQRVAVALPYDERSCRLVDLDRDGKQDLLLHLAPAARDSERPHRLTMLIAR